MTPREQIAAAEQAAREEARRGGRKAPRQKPQASGGVTGERLYTPEEERYRSEPVALRHTTARDGDPWRYAFGANVWTLLRALWRRWRRGEVKRIRIDVIES
jgi:hypothetical protein